MSVSYFRGQQLGRDDLHIYLQDHSGSPTNAAEIYYALYDFTTHMEVLVGPPQRTPSNPNIGEYFASVLIPLDANIGDYRIRWSFRQNPSSPIKQVVQEFSVIEKSSSPLILPGFTTTEQDLARRLRILLRDQCLAGSEVIEVDAEGVKMHVTLKELWEAIHEE